MAEVVKLERRADILGGFADALPDPCLLLDRRSMVIHRNPAATAEFPGVILGQPLNFSLRNPTLHNAVEAARKSGKPQSVELHQTVPNETWHRASVAPLPGSDDVIVITLQSLTEQKRLEELRSDFIANASHELRTPLASVTGFIETLLGPASNDQAARERFLKIMLQQATRMAALIDDLLSLSRIEMRQHLRPTGVVELKRLLAEVRDGLESRAAEAGVEIVLTAAAPVTVTGDEKELYEVFENLIDNAIKYGASGKSVEVTLGQGRSGYDYAVTVVDHGEGVAVEHVPRLTERFYRVDESSRKKKGTGLGLAIVKHIVNRHRGMMTIKSRPGEGMRVEVLLNK